LDTTARVVLSIPVQTREVGKLKKYLSPVAIIFVLLVAILPTISACSVTTNNVTATVYGPDSQKVTDAAKLADEAIAGITKSTAIEVPSTVLSGSLSIGSDAGYPPLQFVAYIMATDAEGKDAKSKDASLVGFEVDLYTAVAKKLGLTPVYLKTSWSDFVSSLNEGKVDMVASGLITGLAVVADLGASDTYLSADLAICTKTAQGLADAAALAGKIVGVQSGSTGESAVAGVASIKDVRAYPRILGAFEDLMAGKVDAVVVEQPVAEWILDNHADYATALKLSGTIESGEGYAFWCKKDNQALLDSVNAALQELRQVPATTQPSTATVTSVPSSATGATTTTVADTVTTVGATNTTAAATQSAKSVYQLLCEKWGLTGN
jgi:polar amino acid transport system substrate-binding protein